MSDAASVIRPEMELIVLLRSLELQLMEPAFRRDRKQVSALLAEDFREFGSSGRVWSRAAILDLLESEDGYTAPQVEDFATQRLSPETVLATYRTVRGGVSTLRSSIWVLRGERWQMLFHQGTRIPSE